MLSPITREVLVDADPVVAFHVFTERIGQWWPVGEFSVHGEGAAVAFIDGAIVETGSSGAVAVWGTVTAWHPPSGLAFTWHPGRDEQRASRVTVTFTAAGEQTLVRLEHAGWEVFDDPQASRTEYDEGWPMVLARFGSALPARRGSRS